MAGKLAKLADQVLALPPAERSQLAQRLWENLDDADRGSEVQDHETIAEALRRDAEITAGLAPVRSHQEVMDAARKAVE